MARIRSIKPEVRISEKVNSWPIECRYFWVLLWGYCDDYGYGRDNSRLIVADAFPLDDSITAEMVSAWMDMLWASGVIDRFEVDGSHYFRVANWDEHQKISHPAKQFLPTIDVATEVFQRPTESLRRGTETFEKTSPKQGAGSREQGTRKAPAGLALVQPKRTSKEVILSEFERAYESWPKKVEKAKSLEAFTKLAKTMDLETLVSDIIRFGQSYSRSTEKKFVPALVVWLNGSRWDDELPDGNSKPIYGVMHKAAPAGQVWAVDALDAF
jgi:hypothetical protein